MKLKGLAIGTAVGSSTLNLIAWISLLCGGFGSVTWSDLLTINIFAFVVGATLGGGLGLAVGAGLGGPKRVPCPLLARDSHGNVIGRLSRSPEKGLSVLDGVTSSLYTLTLTGVGAVALLIALGGPRRLTRLVMDLSPLGSTGPVWAWMSTLGSIAVVTLVPVLAFASTRPPRRQIEGHSRKLIAGAGFLSGLLWPGLIRVVVPLL